MTSPVTSTCDRLCHDPTCDHLCHDPTCDRPCHDLTCDRPCRDLTCDRPCRDLQEEIYLNRVAELDAITSQRDTQRKYYDDLRKQRLNEFMAGFAIITSKLKGA